MAIAVVPGEAAAEPGRERQPEHADEVEAVLPACGERPAGSAGGDAEQVDQTERVKDIHGV